MRTSAFRPDSILPTRSIQTNLPLYSKSFLSVRTNENRIRFWEGGETRRRGGHGAESSQRASLKRPKGANEGRPSHTVCRSIYILPATRVHAAAAAIDPSRTVRCHSEFKLLRVVAAAVKRTFVARACTED